MAETIASFVPATLVEHLCREGMPEAGKAVRQAAAVLFADLSGFTAMADSLASRGQEGAEELQRILNATFGALVEQLHLYGGVVVHFAGDSVSACFTGPDTDACLRAVAAALALPHSMAQEFQPIHSAGGPFRLELRVGVSYGRVAWFVAGGFREWSEYVMYGDALEQAVAAERVAEKGQVVIAPAALDVLGDNIVVRPLSQISQAVGFAVALGLAVQIAHAPLPVVDWRALEGAAAAQVLQHLVTFVPRALYDELARGAGPVISTHRHVSNVFVQFCLPVIKASHIAASLNAFSRYAYEQAVRYGGRLNRILTADKGNQLHVLFGAPTAHADDATRAARFSLALLRHCPSFATEIRVGIATGRVFAGPVGSPSRREYTVIGDTVNIAARLMEACPIGNILLDQTTADSCKADIQISKAIVHYIRGKAQPLTVYSAKQEIAAPPSLGERYIISPLPLVDRYPEQERLDSLLDSTLQGNVGVLTMCGPTGIGKSRLVQWMVERWLEKGGFGFGADCHPHTRDVPLAPWQSIWRAMLLLNPKDPPSVQASQAEKRMTKLAPENLEHIGFLTKLLGLPTRASPGVATLEPEDKLERLLDLQVSMLTALAKSQPLLIILEDVQFADSVTRVVLGGLSERISGKPVLLCITCDDQGQIPVQLLKHPNYLSLQLGELPARFGRMLVESLLGPIDLPDQVRSMLGLPSHADEIVGDGTPINPLYLSAAVQALIDAGVFSHTAGRYRVDLGRLASAPTADSLDGLITSGVDGLPVGERELLRTASILGREFTADLLAAAQSVDRDDARLERSLSRLVEAGYLSRQAAGSYLFRKPAVHRTIYEGISFARRRELHGKIGGWLEEQYQQGVGPSLDVVAGHFLRSSNHAMAVRYGLLAGRQAQEIAAANREAAILFDQAIQHLTEAGSDVAQRVITELYLRRGKVRLALGQYQAASSDAETALEAAALDRNARARAQALVLQAELLWWQERNAEALKKANEAHRIALASHFDSERIASLRWQGASHTSLGNMDQALACYQEGRASAALTGDQCNLALCIQGMAIAHASQHAYSEALIAFQEALDLLRSAGHTNRIVGLLNNIALAHLQLGQPDDALIPAAEAEALARSSGNDLRLAYILIATGEAHCYLGNYSAGSAALREAVDLFERVQDDVGRAYALSGLGRFYAIDVGDHDLGRRVLQESATTMEQLGNWGALLEALLSLARLEIQLANPDAAKRHLQRASSLCTKHGLTWEMPELLVSQAELAILEQDWTQAQKLANWASDQIVDKGCPEWHAPALRIKALSIQQTGEGDPSELYHQSVVSARRRGRRLELAKCLRAAGEHLVTTQDQAAEGSRFLIEATAILRAIGLGG